MDDQLNLIGQLNGIRSGHRTLEMRNASQCMKKVAYLVRAHIPKSSLLMGYFNNKSSKSTRIYVSIASNWPGRSVGHPYTFPNDFEPFIPKKNFL